ncbi:hypothetical protein FGG08_004185 [Glutinoglossum americanum]|uniref:HTH CENPB-type domain-containing protein n=1 Tax=Glutinoglossum americanum TaxID=1670608 RepID=A0A9P8I683_9PEZI|nr:hypothetical protein FGG08_004185 [Glutinoglossum americanum]
MSQLEMDHAQSHGQGQESSFASSQWMEIGGYPAPQHHSPSNEYSAFGYVHSPPVMSVDPNYNRMNPPAHTTHQPLQPLIMPQWPSMLTSQSTFNPPIVPTAPSSAPMSATASSHSTHSTSSPRRTLTDADRRRMCIYHEENPTVKQTEIGAMFGVERSTVSKVLRQKEKYLFPDDGSRSPVKRTKGKFPDIERALSVWAKNSQKQGIHVTDGMIREKARFFATTVGNSESHLKANSTSWLEKFKQKNNIAGAKGSKKKLEPTESDGGMSADTSATHTPNGTNISPTSPNGVSSPPPMSSTRSQDNDSMKTKSPDGYMDFSNGYRHSGSQSTTSLSSVFSDTNPTSPTSPFFTPDSACGPSPLFPSQQARIPPLSSNFNRPRSQTFPLLGFDQSYASPPPSSESMTPKFVNQAMAPPPALPSPGSELPPLTMDETLALSHAESPSSIHAPSHSGISPSSGVVSPGDSIPSPTQEDARRALELVMTFFQQQPTGLVDPQEYMTIGNLMKKLKLQGQALPGGLHQIPEQESMAPLKMEHSVSAGL